MVVKTIDIAPQDLQTVQKILQENIPEFAVWAFGSRLSGNARKYSDLDIVILCDKSIETLRMADLREAFSESDLPMKVDIIEWSSLDEEFRSIIRENYFVLQEV